MRGFAGEGFGAEGGGDGGRCGEERNETVEEACGDAERGLASDAGTERR